MFAKRTFAVSERCSVALSAMTERKKAQIAPIKSARLFGFEGADEAAIHETDRVPVLVETSDATAVAAWLSAQPDAEDVERLDDGYVSARVGAEAGEQLLARPEVRYTQVKRRAEPTLDLALPSCGLWSQATPPARLVPQTGAGVLIGVVDTGFDLSHPAFWDGSQLRVRRLLDQLTGQVLDRAALEAQWQSPPGPGADEDGHGTHVASIAAGTAWGGWEGVAPGAELLLVKTDFVNTDKAVAWIFQQAAGTPCAVNLSLGHHFGGHDGTDVEERLHASLSGPGKIVVVAAGNERNEDIHVGGRFTPGQSVDLAFDVLRRDPAEDPMAVVTAWYDAQDAMDGALVSPSGQVLPLPALGQATASQGAVTQVQVAHQRYVRSKSKKIQVELAFDRKKVRAKDLRGWVLRLTCTTLVVGRLDAWFNNSGYGRFHAHPWLETRRTIGLPATGASCIAVASHVTRTDWASDLGPQRDTQVVVGRSSPFSSQGPTRDGRPKPDLSAPGQYVVAALADGSTSASEADRAEASSQTLAIEGTSMAAPVVTGVIALMLEKNAQLTPDQARDALRASATQDAHTGAAPWSPAYGFGKLDVAGAPAKVP